jgi:hypothetical protein
MDRHFLTRNKMKKNDETMKGRTERKVIWKKNERKAKQK